MKSGVIEFERPEAFDGRDPRLVRRFVRDMTAKDFKLEQNMKRVDRGSAAMTWLKKLYDTYELRPRPGSGCR